jgi:hypothetical protein
VALEEELLRRKREEYEHRENGMKMMDTSEFYIESLEKGSKKAKLERERGMTSLAAAAARRSMEAASSAVSAADYFVGSYIAQNNLHETHGGEEFDPDL